MAEYDWDFSESGFRSVANTRRRTSDLEIEVARLKKLLREAKVPEPLPHEPEEVGARYPFPDGCYLRMAINSPDHWVDINTGKFMTWAEIVKVTRGEEWK
jgi:hypothetical protein